MAFAGADGTAARNSTPNAAAELSRASFGNKAHNSLLETKHTTALRTWVAEDCGLKIEVYVSRLSSYTIIASCRQMQRV